jgi:hypothetical protein
VEEQGVACLSAPHARRRRADRQHLPFRHQHASRSPGAQHVVPWRGERGHREPGWRKAKCDWEAWNTRSLAEEPILRLILDGTVVRVRLDRKATAISLFVVVGVRADRQKC